jgi:GAF domain-containing protein
VDKFAQDVVTHGDDPEISVILREVCDITGMGFAAVAHVTPERWIACQVLDKIEFGLTPGGELDVAKTICDDVRQCGAQIIIDHVELDQDWRTHPVPILYGFQSYASLPLYLADGVFYGTLCAIDPAPRLLSDARVLDSLNDCARRVEAVLARRIPV